MTQDNIDVLVFDTQQDAQAYLDESFKANSDIIETAISKDHNDLEKKAQRMGEGYELRCMVRLFGEEQSYGFMAGVRYLGEFVDLSLGGHSTLSRLSRNINKTLASQGLMYTCYGYRLVSSFYTCIEREQIFPEERKILRKYLKDAKREIEKSGEELAPSMKTKLFGFTEMFAKELLNAPPLRGLTTQEIGAFKTAYSAHKKR